MNTQDHAGKRPAENVSNGNSRHKPSHRLRAILINEPVRKINNHTEEKACLGCAEQETRAAKLQRRADITRKRCEFHQNITTIARGGLALTRSTSIAAGL